MRRTSLAPAPTGPRLLLTPEEAAHVLSVGRTRVYELLQTGEISSVRLGRSRRIPAAALEAFVEDLARDAARAVA